jgi:hypothetical protein
VTTWRRRLQNATMLAHLPRGAVEEYDHLALAAHQSSKESLAAEQRASVPGPVSDCVEAAYQLMCDLLWHPVLSRLTYRWRFRKLLKLVAENRENRGRRQSALGVSRGVSPADVSNLRTWRFGRAYIWPRACDLAGD